MPVQGTGSFAGRVGWSVGQLDWLDDPSSKVNRYWRSIEYGTNGAGFKGRIAGLWSNQSGVNPRPPLSNNLIGNGPLSRFGKSGDQKFAPFDSDRGSGKGAQAALAYYFGISRGQTAHLNLDQIEVRETKDENKRRHKDVAKDGTVTYRMESRGSLTSNAAKRRALFKIMEAAGEGKKVPFVTGDVKRSIKARLYYTNAVNMFGPADATVEALRQVIGPLIGGVDPSSEAGKREGRQRVAFDSTHGVARSGSRNAITNDAGINAYLGDRAGLATFAARPIVTDYLRNGRGFSAGEWQVAVERTNAATAARFQDLVVDLMRQEPAVRRPTGDLVAATLDKRNRYPQNIK